MAPDLLDIDVRRENGRVIVSPVGEIDLSNASHLDEALLPHQTSGTLILIDLSGVEFCDSTCLKTLLQAQGRAGETGYTLTLRAPSRAVTRVLEVAGVTDRFVFETS